MDKPGTSNAPAASHLFMTNEVHVVLPEVMAQLFCHLVAKLLYLCICTRQDIQTVAEFLCTRVKRLDTDYYKKLLG